MLETANKANCQIIVIKTYAVILFNSFQVNSIQFYSYSVSLPQKLSQGTFYILFNLQDLNI